MQLVLLALLGEKPRHGYDLIKAIEERSNGFYVPSPGVIYPALTYLEEAGEALSEAEGNRKLYRLTEAGDKRLDTQRKEVDRLLAQLEELGRGMDRVREAFSRAEDGEESEARGPWSTAPELFQVLHELRHVLAEQRGADHERRLEIIAALRRAIDEIRGARTPDTGR